VDTTLEFLLFLGHLGRGGGGGIGGDDSGGSGRCGVSFRSLDSHAVGVSRRVGIRLMLGRDRSGVPGSVHSRVQ